MCSALNECLREFWFRMPHFYNMFSQTWMFPVKGKGQFVHVQNEIPCHESILGVGCSFTLSLDQGEVEVSGQHHASATLLLMKEHQVCCESI